MGFYTMGKMEYVYLISYSHNNGFGNSEFKHYRKIDCLQEIKEIGKAISRVGKVDGVVVINYILLEEYPI